MLDAQTSEQMALLAGKVEPTTFAGYCIELAIHYNGAGMMIERNNHGHVVIAAALEDGRVRVLDGLDGRPGWLNNQKGKRVLYVDAACAGGHARRPGRCVCAGAGCAELWGFARAGEHGG